MDRLFFPRKRSNGNFHKHRSILRTAEYSMFKGRGNRRRKTFSLKRMSLPRGRDYASCCWKPRACFLNARQPRDFSHFKYPGELQRREKNKVTLHVLRLFARLSFPRRHVVVSTAENCYSRSQCSPLFYIFCIWEITYPYFLNFISFIVFISLAHFTIFLFYALN